MQSFDVLDRNTVIPNSFLLEASAGTGKTFSIEQLVVRLLLQDKPLTLDRFCIVTFTRKATFELKERLRHALKNALSSDFDYIQAIHEAGDEALKRAKGLLSQAENLLDQAHIFTIHSFCLNTLKDNLVETKLSKDSLREEGLLSKALLKSFVVDFFRSKVCEDNFTIAMRSVLFKEYHYDFDALVDALVDVMSYENLYFEIPKPLLDFLEDVNQAIKSLQVTGNHVEETFYALAPHFKGVENRDKMIHKNIKEGIEKIALMVDGGSIEAVIEEGFSVFKAFSLKNLKVKSHHIELPDWMVQLKKQLTKIAEFSHLFLRLSAFCYQFIEERKKAQELLSFDGLVHKMVEACSSKKFLNKVQERYDIALIDEFQDTDALQWQLFKTLFLPKRLILVGDPKQAIYRFRQADIYTYIEAKKVLGEECCYSLDTNFRSNKQLVEALNHFFSQGTLFSLPQKKSLLHYPHVKAGRKEISPYKDTLGALHFFKSTCDGTLEEQEKKCLMPYVIEEIKRLHFLEKIPYGKMAILVADRFQAQRVKTFLSQASIMATMSSNVSFDLLSALSLMEELFLAILYPKDFSHIRKLLLGPFFCYSLQQVKEFNPLEEKEFYRELQHLADVLQTDGFAQFFYQFLYGKWNVLETLLNFKGAEALYDRLNGIRDMLILKERQEMMTPFSLLEFLQGKKRDLDGLERDIQTINVQDAIEILTIHASKGLEFSVVFGMGLVRQAPKLKELFVAKKDETLALHAVLDNEDPFYVEQEQELDAERGRLLYVAMTRAKERFYCPLLKGKNLRKNVPIEGYLSTIEAVDLSTDGMSYQEVFSVTTYEYPSDQEDSLLLIPPESKSYKADNVSIHSFSSLTKKGRKKDFKILDTLPPSRFTIPPGPKTGQNLHYLLEHMTIKKYKNSFELKSFVEEFLDEELKPFSEPISEMIFDAYHTPIFDDQKALIDADQILHEAPFLSRDNEQNMTTGVIDCLAMVDEKIYLIDWKSNFLGEGFEAYHRDNLYKEMKEQDYFKQADLYTEALKRYLELVDTVDFNERFGGVYYLFIRGMTPHKKTGIYHFFPDEVICKR